MPLAEDQHPVGDLGLGGEREPSAYAFARGLRGGIFTASTPGAGQERIEGRGELPGPVPDQESEVHGAITQVHHEVPDLLHGPGPDRAGRDSGHVHVAAAYLHDEQAVQAL